jgi:hypothetical protein
MNGSYAQHLSAVLQDFITLRDRQSWQRVEPRDEAVQFSGIDVMGSQNFPA